MTTASNINFMEEIKKNLIPSNDSDAIKWMRIYLEEQLALNKKLIDEIVNLKIKVCELEERVNIANEKADGR